MLSRILLGAVPTLVVGIAVLTLAAPQRDAVALGQVRATFVASTHHKPVQSTHKAKPKANPATGIQKANPKDQLDSNELQWGGRRGYRGYRHYRGYWGYRGYRGYYADGNAPSAGEQLQ